MLAAAWNILCQLSPWLLVGMVIAGLLHGLLPAGFIHRKLQGWAGVFKAVALGVPLPLCSCGVVPAGIGLKRDGASDGASIGFLISTPQTGVDAVLVSASFLGWPFALFKVVSAAVTGIVGGLLADMVRRPVVAGDAGLAAAEGVDRSVRGMLEHSLEILRSIWIWLVIGVLASAAIEVYVPESVFTQIAAWGSFPAALVALAISLPLYVCATASVPIAAVLVFNGLPPGAALVFLMAGPATNLATMGAVYRTFGFRVLAIYLSTLIVGSIGFALAFDWLLPAATAGAAPHAHEHFSWWGPASALLLVGLLAWFAIQDLQRWLARRRAARSLDGDGPGFKVIVTGMTCDNCVNRLETALRNTEGVDSAVVQLKPGEAIVHGSIDRDRLTEAIRETGFQPEEVAEI